MTSQTGASTVSAISAEIDARTDEIVETLASLVQIPTQTPPGENYDKIVDHLVPLFSDAGLDARRYDLPDAIFEERCRAYHPEMVGVRSNVLATMKVPGKPGLLLYTHLDTMPVGDRDKWLWDPFSGEVRDGYVLGRGTSDSKGGAAAILIAFRALQHLGIEPAVSPVVALTTDEEIGPYTGLMHMADTGIFEGCRWFLSLDGMSGYVGIGTLGAFFWKITIIGRSQHSASSWLGLNPIERSVILIDELMRTKQEIELRRSKLVNPPYARASRSHLSPVLNITMAQAGVKHNVVPAEFVIEGDRRWIASEGADQCRLEIEAAIDRAKARDPELKYSLAITPFFDAYEADPDDPWIRHIADLAQSVRGEEVAIAGGPGTSDRAHVANVTNLKVVGHGLARPGETMDHTPNERVRITDLVALSKLAALALVEPE